MNATPSLGYRPDIDGLRAIAVLAVIAFHASATLLPGGFVGVDIFFVISGYLITGLIAKGIEDNTFSFAEFFTRRIKRIFPAYIVVAIVTLIVSSYLLIPNDYIFYTTSLAASWAFLSNVFFSMLSWGYFGARTEEFPLLHTWSLSVEEQFYFIFPVVLLGLYRFLRKHILLVLLAFAILFVTISQLKAGEVKSYFLLSSRAHELLIGAMTFFIARRAPSGTRLSSTMLASLGVALMGLSMVLIDRHAAFPGINSLYPCIGAALVIYAGRRENAFTPVLASKPMVSLGLISYSLYLWHWPIFSFLRYRRIEITWGVGLAAVALALVLSVLTWKYVERPVRQSKGITFKRAFTQIYVAPALLFMSVGLYSYLTEGAPARFSGDMRELISSYSFERDLGRTCSIRAEDYRKVDLSYLEQNCSFGHDAATAPRVLLMGDSHANHFKPFVEQLAKDAQLRAVFHVQGVCRPTNLQKPGQWPGVEPTTCQKRNADLLAMAGAFKYVVLAGYWAEEAPMTDLEADMANVVGKVLAAGATPVIFKDNPYYEPDVSQCILHRKRGWLDPNTNCHIPYKFVAETQGPVDGIVDRVASRYPGTIVVDPKLVMCDGRECATYIKNIALFKDSNHINAKASKLLAELYSSNVMNPFSSSGQVPAGGIRSVSLDR